MQGWRHAGAGLCLAVFALVASAQTSAGGSISADTVWHAAQSPYVVTSDLLVQNGATLTIEAGTTVYMGADTRFTVQSGALKAIGTAQAPIRLTSQKLQNSQAPLPGDWQQLTFGAGITSTTRLEYVQIEYGKGIVVAGASPIFNNLTIVNNLGAAITADLAASPSGAGNQASGNGSDAIVLPAGDISGSVTWGLRGIPYLVASGNVSVGASPKVLSISPGSLQRGETQTVTLSGSRLSGLAQPAFDLAGLSGQMLAGASATQAQLQVTATAGAAVGVASFSALTDAGEITFANALAVIAVQPKLTSVIPATLAVGQGDAAVTLTGQNFNGQAVAYLDDAALATTYVSPTQISALVPNQLSNAVKSIRLRTPNSEGGAAFVSNEQTIAVITLPPVVTGMTPNALRRGETKAFQITGTGLNTISLSASSPALSISGLALTPTQARFDLSAAADAPLGTQQLTLTNTSGSASAALTVNPALPTASVAPTPIAIPPDGSSRQFAIQLSYADTVSHTFSVTATDPTTIKVSTASLTIAAGQVQVIGSISGLKTGVSSLTLVSSTLGTLSLPVYVTADFLGLNTSIAPLLGVVLTPPPSEVPAQTAAAIAKNLGVVFGNFVREVSPRAFSLDAGTSTLTIFGAGLQGALLAAVKPADGVTVGAVVVAPDGKSVTVPLTVAADAPVSQRQIVLSSASGPYPVAAPDADRIQITYPRPEIVSLDPLFGTPGMSSLNIVARGRNLQAVQSLSISPAEGVTFGVSPTASADGTQLNAVMNIAPSAALGPRVITVNALSGSSDSTASASNTFSIVNALVNTVTPIVSPALGIVKLDNAAPAPNPALSLVAPLLGIAYGSAGTGISPQAKAIGETFTLTVQGIGLQTVTGINFVPATGLSMGPPAIAPDGLSLSVQVAIAADAPQTARTLQLLAGAAPILFTKPANSVFTVTAPQPLIASTDPMAIQLGAAPVVMTLRGQNFQNALSVRFSPPDGMTVSTPPIVDASASQLTLNVSASSGAAAGPRAVIVTTPGGETSADLTVANTVSLGANIATTGLLAPLLGIVKQEAAAPVSSTVGPIVAANLGVVFGEAAPASQPAGLAVAQSLGVAFGAVASAIEPTSLALSSSGTLTIRGAALGGVTGISINPPQGIVIGSPLQLSADGQQVTVPISVASDAAMSLRQVIVNAGTGQVAFANPAKASLQITSNTTLPVSSISPILSTTGSLLTLTVLGQNMQNASAVIASPATGLVFDSQPVVNAAGTELTVRLKIASDAPLGARVIQVLTPTALSSDQASPANTFTVYAP